ncbi:hypothetical protein Nepgr_003260 [Nepenthes gracilis]|uniref:Myb-like domain-containing protein n=1 Tax=Nepenthes gracilis TaxID=150966 RepID=A0AAD3RZ63_NEPGR|nr:hypothetical protein Nepgr_003260 [Nepenthes gracilis]
MAADEGGSSAITMREYRKGNWTLQETTVLIEAKSMDDERRMKKQIGGGEQGKPTELRWKWVEDYCWKRGCFRSQNQCNDKWDNLMRDYKKVRDYQRRFGDDHQTSYWNIDKTQRKDMNLPTCMSSQIYEALAEVVERTAGGRGGRSQRRMLVAGAGGSNSAANSTIAHTSSSRYLTEKATGSSPPPLVLQHSIIPASTPGLTPPPPDPPAHPPPPQPPTQLPLPYFYSLSQPPASTGGSSDSDTSEHHSGSPSKRRRRRRRRSSSSGGGGGSGGDDKRTSTDPKPLEEFGSSISRSASTIADAIHASDERLQKRHLDTLSLYERRLKIEESKLEITRQGINGFSQAINHLANSILALASHNYRPSPPN